MGLENRDGAKFPEFDFSRPDTPAKPVLPFGFNIGAAITETMLVYIQGLFMDNENLDHRFEYSDKSAIKIVDQGGFAQLELNYDPIIVVERGSVQSMGRGGMNNLLSVATATGVEERVDLFTCPINIKVYGDYSHVEQYASLIFLSLTFLTEPLKKFTIYRVQPPSMSAMRAVSRDSKVPMFTCAVSTVVIKEGYVKISPKHHPVLRKFAFKGRQIFESGDRVIIRIS
jgi:hypothetical protein